MAYEHIHTAVSNSRSSYHEDEMMLPELWSTKMHVLTEKILRASNDEILRIISENQAKARYFRSLDNRNE